MEGEYEATIADIEDIFVRSNPTFPEEKVKIGMQYIEEIIKEYPSLDTYDSVLRKLNKRFKKHYRKSDMLILYYMYVEEKGEEPDMHIVKLLQKVRSRSRSGVLVVTVFTSPGKFSCPEDCHYCPNEVDENGKQTQPRSYLSTEPGCMRALRDKFHPLLQFFDRVRQLEVCGHPADKIEILVLGGTWSFYPVDYQEWFIASLYNAANTYYERKKLYMKGIEGGKDIESLELRSLEEEQLRNEKALCRIIGITLETRPDCVLSENRGTNRHYRKQNHLFDPLAEIRRFRRYGVTRVQIGLQHIRDDILKKINRKCTNDQNIRAIKVLKENCIKVDGHFMFDLPGSSPLIDMEMIKEIHTKQEYTVDYEKLYPTMVNLQYTRIGKWYTEGSYKPYAEIEDGKYIKEVIGYAMETCPVSTRVNRVFRDFPLHSIDGGCNIPNLRQVVEKEMNSNGKKSRNIRDREIKDQKLDVNNAEIVVRDYKSSDGIGYFISFEDVEMDILYGFLRLRFNDPSEEAQKNRIDCLKDPKIALIRELHVYGNLTKVNRARDQNCKTRIILDEPEKKNAQHYGFGRRLIARAEEIARTNGYTSMAIISGVGVREYYRKFGYQLIDTYMIKSL